MNIIIGTVSAVLLWMAVPAAAQAPCPTPGPRSKPIEMTVYSLSELVNYPLPTNNFTKSGKTKVYFEGTDRMPTATGDARIEEKTGYISVDANFDHMQPACVYGPDFLTYVLWAITPEGRVSNLGEVVLNGKHEDRAKLDVTTEFQAFGLMVTAEPHFAVSRPSNVVVLQNIALPEPVAQACGCCVPDPCALGDGVARSNQPGMTSSEKSDIVKAGDDVKSDVEKGGKEFVDKTEDVISKGGDVIKKGVDAVPGVHIDSSSSSSRTYTDSSQYTDWGVRPSVAQARNAVRLATAAGATQYAPETLAKAKSLLSQAETDNNGPFIIRTDALAREAAQTAEDARIISMRATELAAFRKMQTDQSARLKAEEGLVVGEAIALAEAERALMKSEDEKAALRAKLAQQLNMIMTTRDTVRGLIVDMADVRFDTGRYQLRPVDKEKLAKVSGILLAYPGLTIEVEGFTDNVGTTESNQTLSERRAQAVRDYFVSQGIPASRITAKGLGETTPTASNDTPEGRQKNRRVELVVSGDSIGTTPNGNVQ